ncbi:MULTISPECIES: type I-F CRISPR-associated endoribonuclease Cas6/Csy4 [unclassified Moraxella]|uniref:type I-F CRISPR-associated endoribonuclease Cas6/Csy4 n=1 Tax=unclassified Moraxella TaxID=2685852 RepID=UPI003AF948C1
MKFYQELTIIPEPEIPPYVMWSKIFTQLHIAFADVKNNHGIDTIGVSFPNYQFTEKQGKTFATLGYKLRIFAPTEQELQTLNLDKWLERLTDYVHIKRIQAVPKPHGFVVVKRYRYKDFDKKVAEFAEFKGISQEDALTHCREHKRPIKHYPFISLKSETNQSDYKLSIVQESANSEKVGSFNTYGINNQSKDVTVPHW